MKRPKPESTHVYHNLYADMMTEIEFIQRQKEISQLEAELSKLNTDHLDDLNAALSKYSIHSPDVVALGEKPEGPKSSLTEEVLKVKDVAFFENPDISTTTPDNTIYENVSERKVDDFGEKPSAKKSDSSEITTHGSGYSSDIISEKVKNVDDFPEFTDAQKSVIQRVINEGNANSVLIKKFNLPIVLSDINTLHPLTWLNDQIINFYMNLLTERGELRSSEGYPKVYAMNTVFTLRLFLGGYQAVRRWTKNVNLFNYDVIPVPVHNEDHWTMAIIHMKEKTIKYYDSKGAPNTPVLNALRDYLKEESLDKRNLEFDYSGWITENVCDSPRQENDHDCGVFSCMIAEFVCRNRPTNFNQQHINYFRKKMVLEICEGKLLL